MGHIIIDIEHNHKAVPNKMSIHFVELKATFWICLRLLNLSCVRVANMEEYASVPRPTQLISEGSMDLKSI